VVPEARAINPFSHKNPETFGPDSAWVRDFVELAADLTAPEAARADLAAQRTGFIASRSCDLAVAMLITAGSILKLNAERGRAQRAGGDAIGRCAGARGSSPVLAYAAGCMAEAFAVRRALDPTTWSWITEPWRSVFEVPPLYEGDEPEAVARARRARASIEHPDATRR
jgi:hypothetical protein